LPRQKRNSLSALTTNIGPKPGEKKIQGSVNKAIKVYNALGLATSEALIPCDPNEPKHIYAKVKRTGRIPHGCGFKSIESVKTWASNLSSFFDVVSGRRVVANAFATLDDDWAALLNHLVGHTGGPVILNTYERISLNALTRECRLRGLSLRTLTAGNIEGIARDLLPNMKQTIRRGAMRLEALRTDARVPECLLPVTPIGPLAPLTSPIQRVIPPLHPELQRALDTYIDMRRRGETSLEYGTETRKIETNGISEERAKNIAVAVRWYWHGTVELDLTAPDKSFNLDAFTRPEVLADVVAACAAGGLGPICQTDVRRARVNSVIQFLTHLQPDYDRLCNPKLLKAKELSHQKEGESVNAALKRETCLRFINDEAFQRQFFSMPRVFFDEAKSLIDRFDTLKTSDQPGLSRTQHRALDLAIMAAHTTIVTRYPLRLSTTHRLLSDGIHPHVILPENQFGPDTVTLLVPGNIVKNGYFSQGVPLSNTKTVHPQKIITWYLKKAHPLILKHKPTHKKHRQPNALFCGLHVETLRRIWRNYVEEIGLHMTPHMCRHLVASHLYANGVPLCQIAELLGDKEETVRNAYIFVDRVRMIRDVMDAQAAIYRRLGV